MAGARPADSWHLPWTGSCRCGRVSLRITKSPWLIGACHCTGCQKMSASAFSLTVSVPGDGFATSGLEPVIGGLHGEERHHFCPWCMNWMFTRVDATDEFVNVRASMLDDHRWVVPYAEFWTSEKLPWASTSARASFATEPPDEAFAGLLEGFARDGARPQR
ncbi:MAG: GFA family protein [Caldimonas sp.]